MEYISHYNSPLGKILLVADDIGLTGLWFEGQKYYAQAVGGAVGRNPISIIVPCHRVVGTNGSLTEYAGGLDKKRKLLELENIVEGSRL